MSPVAVTRATGLHRYAVHDFRKGLDVKTAPLTQTLSRGQNALRRGTNVMYTESGSVVERAPHRSIYVGSSAVGKISGGTQYRKSDGTLEIIFGTESGALYRLDALRHTTSSVTTELATGLTTGTRWYFAQYGSSLIICNRADAPRVYDGSTVTTLAGSPPSKGGPVVVHGSRVFMLDAEDKERLSWCALNTPTDWTTASNAGSMTVSPGVDCINLVPSINELVIITTARPHRLQGTNPSTFAQTALVPTTGSIGGVSHLGAVFAGNDVWYLARSGVAALSTTLNFGDLKARMASERIAPYFEPGTAYTLAIQHLDAALAAYDDATNRLYFAVDSNADHRNDMLLVYDLALGAWSEWRGFSDLGDTTPTMISAMWTVRDVESGRTQVWLAVGSPDPATDPLEGIVSTEIIALEQPGAAATSATRFGEFRHLSDLGLPGVEKTLRYGFFYFKEMGGHTENVELYFDGAVRASKSYTTSMLGASKTLGVGWILGTHPLGAAPQITKRVDLSGTAEYVEVGIRNSANAKSKRFQCHGFEILSRPRRQVRRGV